MWTKSQVTASWLYVYILALGMIQTTEKYAICHINKKNKVLAKLIMFPGYEQDLVSWLSYHAVGLS